MTINATYGAGSLSNFDKVLKELYPGATPTELGYKDLPLLAMMSKDEGLGGRLYPVPCIVSPSAGVGPAFTNAQNNQAVPKYVQFQITTSNIYSLATVENKLVQAAKTDKQAFVNAVKNSTDQAIKAASKYLGLSMYRPNTGVLGVISSIAAGGVITLTNRSDACNFEYGQCLNCSTSGTTATVLVTGTGGTTIAKTYVVARDPIAGTITVGNVFGTAATVTTGCYEYNTSTGQEWAAGCSLTLDGALDGTASNNMFGLLSWLPTTAPTASAFFGVDRSVDRQRLAGTYYNGAQKMVIEALSNHLGLIAEAGGKPTHQFMGFSSYQAAVNEIAQKAEVSYVELKGKDINVSFEGVVMHGPRGKVVLVPDFSCPAALAFSLDMDTWKLGSIGKAPSVFNTDGLPMLRVAAADQVEIRIGSYAQIYTTSPVSHGVVALSA